MTVRWIVDREARTEGRVVDCRPWGEDQKAVRWVVGREVRTEGHEVDRRP